MSSAADPRLRVSSSKGGDTTAHDKADPAPDHHLWRNGRLWWTAFTVHLPGWRKDRVRLSLATDDLIEARRRRDEVLADYPAANGCALSIRGGARRGGR